MRYIGITLVCVVSAFLLGPASSHAQVGLDIVNSEMHSVGLFTPHRNNCNSSTEAFVAVGQNGTGGNRGFCIEKDQRNGSGKSWEDARQDCAGGGMRLPEPAEFKIACESAGALGLSNMTDDWEWTSNFAFFNVFTGTQQMEVPLYGNGGCTYVGAAAWAKSDGSENTNYSYRCVR